MKNLKSFCIIYFTFFITTSLLCSSDTIEIVFSRISGSPNYEKYCHYLQKYYPSIKCINAYGIEVNELRNIMANACGVVLTGGLDVNPKYYGRAYDSALCEVDDYRDSLEFALLEIAFEKKLPIFAICRGEQILNVYLGGTLFPDLPTYYPSDVVHRCKNPSEQCLHKVVLDKSSFFYKLVQEDTIIVNSFHHQGVERLGKGLRKVAWTLDGLIESYEWEDPKGKPTILAVQWHPERLPDENPVSRALALEFINRVLEYKKNLPRIRTTK
ncbi:MAG: gamma-glutamyl-gamma-aminobutyrate hydrolase family protein [Ignavibacteria bacterium]|nr:gamma-glutamyl-gamma-aminobutyrate hydrolase family protein [Ignavibacteria bacterium]